LKVNYKSYWRKSGLKGNWGNIFLKQLSEHKPKNFLEIGVFCGVTAKNVCNFLKEINVDDFKYIGIDLFGGEKISNNDEIEPKFLKNQKFSNPIKNLVYNYILREKLNSLKSVENFLKEYKNNIQLIQGDSNMILKSMDLQNIEFAFIDGGHSYKTVQNDLDILYKNLKGKKSVLLCDDYGKEGEITEVKNAIDDYVKIKNLKLEVIENRFAKIIV
tara:strand:- start:357 stop:1004 length:648 start_codon:yes stop_codon:yes gene_type:complete